MSQRVEIVIQRNAFPVLQRVPWRVAFGRMYAYLINEMGGMFDTAGRSRGHPWQEIAVSTLIWKGKTGRSTEILQLRGTLRGSFRPLELNDDRLVFGTDVSHAKYHDSDRPRQVGPDGSPRLPQRKLIRALPKDADIFGMTVRDLIEETARRGGA